MMVSDWIIGMWTAGATLMIVIGFIKYVSTVNKLQDREVALLFGGGVVMVIFSAMHYSGM